MLIIWDKVQIQVFSVHSIRHSRNLVGHLYKEITYSIANEEFQIYHANGRDMSCWVPVNSSQPKFL